MLITAVSLDVPEKNDEDDHQKDYRGNRENSKAAIGLSRHEIGFLRFDVQTSLLVIFKGADLFHEPGRNLNIPFQQNSFLCLKPFGLVRDLPFCIGYFLFDIFLLFAFVDDDRRGRGAFLFPEDTFEQSYFLFLLFNLDRIEGHERGIYFRIKLGKGTLRFSSPVVQGADFLPD